MTEYDPPLDTGIAPVVHFLNEFGFETFESCEGGEGHAYPYPTVRFHGDIGMGFRVFGLLRDRAIPMMHLARLWQVIDGEPIGPYWEISFACKIESLDGYFVGAERIP